MNKQTVHYDIKLGATVLGIGMSAYLFPKDHTSSEVSNESLVKTSPVESYDPTTGIILTKNTKYIPEGTK